ncbi:MAG: transporter [Frateuria sp.]|uniref:transporter n=1 Tax=Frateuria sp. TaxID=2211372 RepID=UPI0017DEA0C7|nr:transporter [Frateuria sp.]NUO72117.1 transporter [Frateuria sp.]NUR21419.1 transporter [Frateuria sp.]
MRSTFCALGLGLLLLGTTAAQADDGRLSVGAGANYSTGKYGTDTSTDIWSVPITAGWQNDRWTLKLTVPYVGISGSSDVIPGTGGVKNGNPHGRGHGQGNGAGSATASTGSASGLGDIVASAGYELFSSADHSAGLDLTGKVKFGTADEDKGLGTGKNDYGLALDAYKAFGDWTVFGGAGWMKYGSSQYIKLKNGFNANLGAGFKMSQTDDVGAYYYYREKIADGGAAQSELTAYWNHKIGDNWRLQSYVMGGMADGSPDWGVGATAKYLF